MGFGGRLYTARMECFEAAEYGNLDLLKQLRESGYSWNKWTCAGAAQHGHLETLQWARKNGCPWDEETCLYAARNGHLDVLRWARKNGCPWDERTCGLAVHTGQLETLRWAIENGCDHSNTQIDKKACVERGVFPGYGCLVAGCSDTKKSEGLCTIHKATIYGILQAFMCNNTAKLVLEIICAR